MRKLVLSQPLGTSHWRARKGAIASGGKGASAGLWAPHSEMIGHDKLTAGTKPYEIDLITSDQIRLFSVRGMFSWVMT